MDKIKVTLSYNRYNENTDLTDDMNESYHNTFTMTDDDRYYIILEKVEVMLKSLGYEFNGHLEFSGLVESNETDDDNVIKLHPDE
mgnify:CR=1 FL=1